ncbi:hypothetical protein GUJ93_ZPchr0006g42343 [Zizania palustris]|uniref:DUF7597 domain-containing protein n=1 Tax=Zizania palustris TaxID=103762 RepID=A0A8J5T292_ZIZPA|nr:hypothetical protein GUJ93_ZPchr0006g42343 [Zizania palustris]
MLPSPKPCWVKKQVVLTSVLFSSSAAPPLLPPPVSSTSVHPSLAMANFPMDPLPFLPRDGAISDGGGVLRKRRNLVMLNGQHVKRNEDLVIADCNGAEGFDHLDRQELLQHVYHHITQIVASFGKLLYWHSEDTNLSRVLLKVMFDSTLDIPRSITEQHFNAPNGIGFGVNGPDPGEAQLQNVEGLNANAQWDHWPDVPEAPQQLDQPVQAQEEFSMDGSVIADPSLFATLSLSGSSTESLTAPVPESCGPNACLALVVSETPESSSQRTSSVKLVEHYPIVYKHRRTATITEIPDSTTDPRN